MRKADDVVWKLEMGTVVRQWWVNLVLLKDVPASHHEDARVGFKGI